MSLNDIKKRWQELSDKINGQVSFKEDIQSNIEGFVFLPEILKEESLGKVQVKQNYVIYGDDKFRASLVTLTYHAATRRTIDLQIWKKGFIEKVFNSGLKTGDEPIDKKYCIKSSSKRDALTLLKIPELRNYFLTQKEFYFNIDTKKGEVIVTFRVNELNNIINAYKVLKAIIKEINI